MAPSETTTLRVPVQLRDEIARLAEDCGTTMVEVVTDAIHRLERDRWWDAVHDAIETMDEDEVASYRAESEALDGTAGDGLRAD